MVDAESARGSNGKTAIVLVEGHKIHSHGEESIVPLTVQPTREMLGEPTVGSLQGQFKLLSWPKLYFEMEREWVLGCRR